MLYILFLLLLKVKKKQPPDNSCHIWWQQWDQQNSCEQPTRTMAESTTIARVNDDPSLELIEGENIIDSRRRLRPQQTVIYRLEPEVGQCQQQGDQQSDRRRAKRGKG